MEGEMIKRAREPSYLLWSCIFEKYQESYTHGVSPTQVPQQDLYMDETNIHANMEKGQSHPGPNST